MNWVDKVRKLNKEYIVCVGIDPVLSNIQKLGLNLLDWSKIIIDSTAEYTDAYKFQLAYFEENGIEGLSILKTSLEYLKSNYPEKVIIGDSKRSDIGSTAAAYARAMYDYWQFDVSTVNPYFGSDSIIPFVEKNGAIIICKSSNNSSNEIQNLKINNVFIYEKVLDIVNKCNKLNNLGIVVGATYPEELKKIRSVNIDLPILIPGLGFQGGDFRSTIQASKGGINILNSSRGICFPKDNFDSLSHYKQSVNEAVKEFKKNIYDVN
jgi:orotidine-5'-phosphate decarboxylase